MDSCQNPPGVTPGEDHSCQNPPGVTPGEDHSCQNPPGMTPGEDHSRQSQPWLQRDSRQQLLGVTAGSAGAQGSHVAVDLLGLAVAPQQPPQDPHAPHPGDLLGHAGVGPLTDAHVAALAPGQRVLPAAGAGVNRHRLADDQPVLDQLPDLLPWERDTTAHGTASTAPGSASRSPGTPSTSSGSARPARTPAPGRRRR
uniref:Uncharacterized protein n=1 Tax=Cyanoderma ruficeps TaxID=181631 RepID=A0A8C3NXS9_9PASS